MKSGVQQDMTRLPIIPRSKADPTGQMKFVRSAEDIFKDAINNIRDRYIEVYRSIPRKTISSLKSDIIVNRQYFFEIDANQIALMQEELNAYIDSQLEIRSGEDHWFFKDYVREAYERGTRVEYANLAAQSAEYAVRPLGYRMLQQAYQRRIELVRYRVFEEMQGFASTVKKDMSLILSDAIANGQGIQETTKQIMDRANVEQFRARRIARTEVLTAYRRARLDEAEQASIEYGFMTKMLWVSAFAPTSRAWHLSRHGKLYSEEEVRDFYSRDGNAINCMCTQTSVLVDGNGDPVNDILVNRLVKMKENAMKYKKELE